MGSSEGPSVKSFPDPLLAGEVTSIDSSKNVIISNHTHTKSKISKQAHTHTNTHALQTQTHMCEHAHKDKHTLREVETHTHTPRTISNRIHHSCGSCINNGVIKLKRH